MNFVPISSSFNLEKKIRTEASKAFVCIADSWFLKLSLSYQEQKGISSGSHQLGWEKVLALTNTQQK